MPLSLSERLFRLAHGRKMAAFAGIPGPPPRFPLGNAADFLGRHPWEVCAEYGRDHGPMAVAWLGGKPVVVLNDPALIARVLGEGADGYYKDAPKQALEPVITRRCLFLANDDDWAHRRSIHPARGEAADEWLATSAVPAIRDAVAAGVRRLAASPPGDLYDGLERVAFDAFAVAVFGRELGDAAYAEWTAMGKTGSRRMTSPEQFAPPLCPMFYLTRRRWYGRFDALIADARRDPTRPGATSWPGPSAGGPPPRPTTSATSWPTSSTAGSTRPPAASSPPSTSWPTTPRNGTACSPTSEGSTSGPPASTRPASPPAPARRDHPRGPPLPHPGPPDGPERRHRPRRRAGRPLAPGRHHPLPDQLADPPGPAHWPEPDRFDPGRWESPGPHPLSGPHFFPFGQGPRTCVGMPFAMAYMETALATILAGFRVELDLSLPYKPGYFFGVMIPKGLAARFVPTGQPAAA